MITTEQIRLVQRSFTQIMPMTEAVAQTFYANLFELDPTLRPMFKTDMREQGQKLMQMLVVAVGGLNRLDEITPAVRALGARHDRYGVRQEHYETVGTALLAALETSLGSTFTPEVKEAWVSAYRLLADIAIQGAAA